MSCVPSCHHPITILSPAPLEDNAEGGEKAKLLKRTSFIVSDAQNAAKRNVVKPFHKWRYSVEHFLNLNEYQEIQVFYAPSFFESNLFKSVAWLIEKKKMGVSAEVGSNKVTALK